MNTGASGGPNSLSGRDRSPSYDRRSDESDERRSHSVSSNDSAWARREAEVGWMLDLQSQDGMYSLSRVFFRHIEYERERLHVFPMRVLTFLCVSIRLPAV